VPARLYVQLKNKLVVHDGRTLLVIEINCYCFAYKMLSYRRETTLQGPL